MNKKAQEEIVGFVLIVVLVAVIAVILLGISLRSSNVSEDKIESQRIAGFLSSLSQLTTSCEIPESNPITISELINRCINQESCSSGVNSCEALEITIEEVLEASYLVSEGSFTKYYNLTIYDLSDNSQIINPINKGNFNGCPGRILKNNRAFTIIGFSTRQVVLELEVCFNN